jgi:hypothetical protein
MQLQTPGEACRPVPGEYQGDLQQICVTVGEDLSLRIELHVVQERAGQKADLPLVERRMHVTRVLALLAELGGRSGEFPGSPWG